MSQTFPANLATFTLAEAVPSSVPKSIYPKVNVCAAFQ